MKVIVRRSSYSYDQLRPRFFELMDALGGEKIRRQERVLIKPNLLMAAAPDRAITTHPSLVRAAAEYVLERGAIPQISDSPAMGSFERIMDKGGFRDALAGKGVVCLPFKETRLVDLGHPFGRVALAEEALDAGVIINLPKLKTHAQLLLTLGVKNMFGAVVGFEKPQWHMKMGSRRELFALLMVRIYEQFKPAFTILDGITALEGDGPGRGGRPREVGVIMGSSSAHALDLMVCRLLKLDPARLPTLKVAREMGLLPDPLELDGELPRVAGFILPALSPNLSGPKFIQGFIRRHLLSNPRCDPDLCNICGECGQICPVEAVSYEGKAIFDLKTCIRCYCCQEICPEGAIMIREPLAGRLLGRLF
ncbi:MAG: DUF362 domain-containing protein [Smithellaceae bacterium]|nr:DUF362 domain-containing protein [Smithellaceae bacterium]